MGVDHDAVAAARLGPGAFGDGPTPDTPLTTSEADQNAADADQVASDADQVSSDEDQARADRGHAGKPDVADQAHYESTRAERAQVTQDRQAQSVDRAETARSRGPAGRSRVQVQAKASLRDDVSAQRDKRAVARDVKATDMQRAHASPGASEARRIEELRAGAEVDRAEAAGDRAKAAEDRAHAADDRAHAADDRADAAVEQARLEKELQTAHLDDLTGVYGREMGRRVLSQEVDRARRGDGRFVLAFVDVDGLKGTNDRDGHAAGDVVLKAVADAMRAQVRSFDPIMRFGGDEFVAGFSGTDEVQVQRRFDAIVASLATADISVTVGLATLDGAETADELMARADRALYRRREDVRG